MSHNILITTIFLLFFATISVGQTPTVDSKTQEIVFEAVNVIPMDRETVIPNQTVVIKNGTIKAIGEAGKVKFSKKALVINAKGKYLMPGLAEMHAHVPPIEDMDPMKKVLALFAVNGVTTIRGMLGHPKHLELKKEIAKGKVLSPRFYTSGPSFNGISVKTPEGGAEMVRNQKKAGYDFLKMHPGLNVPNFEAIVKTAQEVKIPFAGHVSAKVGVWRAIDARYATIDHLDGFMESLVPNIESMAESDIGLFGMFLAPKADTTQILRLMQALKEKNIWVVPTQALAERWFNPNIDAETFSKEPEMKYMTAEEVQAWVNAKNNLHNNPKFEKNLVNQFIQLRRKLIYECYKNGVGLLLGSDAPQVFDVPGFSLHQELKYMVAAGLTPYQALQTGTVNVARFFNRTDMGVVKIGAVSDLILLNGNPLESIEQSKNIEGVMLGNLWLSNSFIQAALKKLGR
jgi:imidazolonepropionase-like amidohydrolase